MKTCRETTALRSSEPYRIHVLSPIFVSWSARTLSSMNGAKPVRVSLTYVGDCCPLSMTDGDCFSAFSILLIDLFSEAAWTDHQCADGAQ